MAARYAATQRSPAWRLSSVPGKDAMVRPEAKRRRKTMAQQPAHKLRIGVLQVTIWRNHSIEKGTTWYSVVPSRSYKKGDDTWTETESLGFDDVLPMAELLRQAFAWITRQMQADSKVRKARQDAESEAA
jgi:hypothetical protein